jgi:ankyrin repeat protein
MRDGNLLLEPIKPPSPSLKHVCFFGPGLDTSSIKTPADHVRREWQAQGLTKEQYAIAGSGLTGSPHLTPQEMTEALKNSTPTTHRNYNAHGGPIFVPFADANGNIGGYLRRHGLDLMQYSSFEYSKTTEHLLVQHKNIPGIAHIWGCFSGMAFEAKYFNISQTGVLWALGDRKPVIAHSGEKYVTWIDQNLKGIADQAAFGKKFEDKYGRSPNVYDTFEYYMLTSPETVYYGELVDGKIQCFKGSAPKKAVGPNGLETYLDWEVTAYRAERIKWGHDPATFADWSRETGLAVTTPEVRQQYIQDSIDIELNRSNVGSKHAAEYIENYLSFGMDLNFHYSNGSTILTDLLDKKNHSLFEKALNVPGINVDLPMEPSKQTPLMYACQIGDEAAVKMLLDKGAKIDLQDINGYTALTWALYSGYTNIIETLLDKNTDPNLAIAAGMDFNFRWSDGWTLLTDITHNKNHAFLEKALKLPGIDINLPLEPSKKTPLMMACEIGDEVAVKMLLDKDAKIDLKDAKGGTALTYAYNSSNIKIMRTLLDKGASPDVFLYSDTTLLLDAVLNNEKEAMDLLLEKNANVNFASKDMLTPLMMAMSESPEIVKALLAKRADATKADINGETALMYGCESGKLENVKLILAQKIDPNITDNFGITALHIAAKLEAKDFVTELLNHGAKIDIQDNYGDTALMFACRTGNTETALELIARGADINIPNKKGETPFQIAFSKKNKVITETLLNKGVEHNPISLFNLISSGQTFQFKTAKQRKSDLEFLDMLLKHGLDVDQRDEDGLTALMVACMQRKTDEVKLLLQHGANPNLTDKEGYSAFYFACGNGEVEIAKALRDSGADVTKSAYGAFTPLISAVINGNEKMVEYILSSPEATREYITRKADSSIADDFCRKNKVEMTSEKREMLDKSPADLARRFSNAIADKIEDKIAEFKAKDLDKYKRPSIKPITPVDGKKTFVERYKDEGGKELGS